MPASCVCQEPQGHVPQTEQPAMNVRPATTVQRDQTKEENVHQELSLADLDWKISLNA